MSPDLQSARWVRASELAGYATLLLVCASFSDFPYAPRWYWAFLPCALYLLAATTLPALELARVVRQHIVRPWWQRHKSWASWLIASHALAVVSWLVYFLKTPHPLWLLLLCTASTSSMLMFTYVIVSSYRASRRPRVR